MQPTFMPWIGYFAMMDRVETFVYLDTVQFERRSWQSRNRLKGAQGEFFVTVPVINAGRRDQKIFEVEIDLTSRFFEKLPNSLKTTLGSTPHYKQLEPELLELLAVIAAKRPCLLTDLNIALIEWTAKKLQIRVPRVIRSRELSADGKKASLLVEICRELQTKRYLSAPGSREYIQESGEFERAEIEVIYHTYQHPQYSQSFGDFVPYLSALDLLTNEGPRSLEILRSGVS
jgi:hypothetical protein